VLRKMFFQKLFNFDISTACNLQMKNHRVSLKIDETRLKMMEFSPRSPAGTGGAQPGAARLRPACPARRNWPPASALRSRSRRSPGFCLILVTFQTWCKMQHSPGWPAPAAAPGPAAARVAGAPGRPAAPPGAPAAARAPPAPAATPARLYLPRSSPVGTPTCPAPELQPHSIYGKFPVGKLSRRLYMGRLKELFRAWTSLTSGSANIHWAQFFIDNEPSKFDFKNFNTGDHSLNKSPWQSVFARPTW